MFLTLAKVPVEGTVMLNCPFLNPVWWRENNLALPSTSVDLKYELVIWNAELQHAGEYGCAEKEGVGQDAGREYPFNYTVDLVVYGEYISDIKTDSSWADFQHQLKN